MSMYRSLCIRLFHARRVRAAIHPSSSHYHSFISNRYVPLRPKVIHRHASTMHSDTSAPPAPGPERISSLAALSARRAAAASLGRRIGFVPTMGALHAGHLDLVRAAARHSDEVYVSIFVNPTQFGPTEDLDRYPRPLAADLHALSTLDAELARSPTEFPGRVTTVWTPSVADMYPYGVQAPSRVMVTPALAGTLEGRSRPGFFDGVATVVLKLLTVVRPTAVFLGQKDFQQCVVLERLVREFLLHTRVHIVPTAREPDGLALSSRNRYLGSRRGAVAPALSRALEAGIAHARSGDGGGVLEAARKVMDAARQEQEGLPPARRVRFDVDYLSLVDRESLREVERVEPGSAGAALVGAIVMHPIEEPKSDEMDPALAKPVRLIDNMILAADKNS